MRRLWASIPVAFVLMVVVFSALTPFSAGSGAAIDWALAWACAMTLLYAGMRRSKRKTAAR